MFHIWDVVHFVSIQTNLNGNAWVGVGVIKRASE